MATTANDFIQAYLADERLGAIGGFFRNNKLAKANAKGGAGAKGRLSRVLGGVSALLSIMLRSDNMGVTIADNCMAV